MRMVSVVPTRSGRNFPVSPSTHAYFESCFGRSGLYLYTFHNNIRSFLKVVQCCTIDNVSIISPSPNHYTGWGGGGGSPGKGSLFFVQG